ncbi:MAG: DUF1573 domain-containing protein [Muribaculaceae bacterium]|nr:DUF1573 domain-containing protein [Muribaculaceae bacterium]
MKRLLISLLLATVGITFTSAQVKWLETEYDYGTFREASGPQKGSVRFVNTGSEPTFISSVRPSCGCTAAAYTESMIEPGDTATVSFIYNPYGRPGPFDKTVKIFLGKDREMKVVKIKGTVIGTPETLMTAYPYSSGPLRMSADKIETGEIKKGHSRHLFINLYNQSEDTIRPVWKNDARALEMEITPSRLAPGEIATLGFYLRTPLEKEVGPVEYPVVLTADANDPHSETREIKVSALITPNPAEAAFETNRKSGHLFVAPDYVDLGEVTPGSQRKFRFELVNDGAAPLTISRVYCLDDAVRLKKVSTKIKPGKRVSVEGEFNSTSLKEGPFRLKIEVMSNDPLNPVKTIRLVGEIRK